MVPGNGFNSGEKAGRKKNTPIENNRPDGGGLQYRTETTFCKKDDVQ